MRLERLRQRRKPLLLLLLVLVSVAAIVSDISGTFGHTAAGRIVLEIFSPLIKGVHIVRTVCESIADSFFRLKRLRKENQSLREELARSLIERALLVKQVETLKCSDALVSLCPGSEEYRGRLLPAYIIAFSPNPWCRTVIIDRGNKDGVCREQTVMNETGVVGVVREVASDTAQVLLLIDQRSAVTVKVVETGDLAVARGTGKPNSLVLLTEGMARRLRSRDHAVTAGLESSLFPGDLPVGTVEDVERDKFGRTEAVVKTAVDFHRLNVLFVLVGSEAKGRRSFADTH